MCNPLLLRLVRKDSKARSASEDPETRERDHRILVLVVLVVEDFGRLGLALAGRLGAIGLFALTLAGIDLGGFVLTRNCKPIARALLDIWQANDRGEYDNRGFKLRGHMYSDENGHFRFRTIVPGPYEDRTRHIHFKVQAPGQSVLTTQLYFPDEPRNRSDVFFRQDLVIPAVPAEGGISGMFNFVLDMSS